jgi:hypothetical protein
MNELIKFTRAWIDSGLTQEHIDEMSKQFDIDQQTIFEAIAELRYGNIDEQCLLMSEDISSEEVEQFNEAIIAELKGVEAGQMSKRGIAGSWLLGGLAGGVVGAPVGVALYALYKQIRKKYEAQKLKCDKEKSGYPRNKCLFDARKKNYEDKITAIKNALGKVKDPKAKAKAEKTAKKEIAKIQKKISNMRPPENVVN